MNSSFICSGPSGLCAGGRKENGLAVARLPVLNPSQLAPLALPSQLAPLALPSQLAPLALPDLLTPMDTGLSLSLSLSQGSIFDYSFFLSLLFISVSW